MTHRPDPLHAYEARKKSREPFPLRPGFEVRVHTRLKEGEKERTQVYEGIIIAMTGTGLGKTFTVRRVASGIGVERVFPMFSPLIIKVDVVRATKVRRARLTYLRRAGVQKRRKEDAGLMRKVEAEREAAQRAKEAAEAKVREEREAAEKTAKEAQARAAAEKNTAEEEARKEAKPTDAS